jgi:hypothetical protein
MEKIKTWAVIAMVLVMAGWAQAVTFRPLLQQERASIGATHVLEVSYADMSAATTTNAAYTNAISVAANSSVSVVALVLETAFDTANTNHTGSLALTIGDTNDTDRLLASTELASDGTEVFLKLGAPVTGAATTLNAWTNATLATSIITTVVDSATNTYTVVTNVTGVAAAVYSGYTLTDGAYVYTAAETVNCIFTPNAEESPSENTSGKVRVYFRILDKTEW